MPIPVRRASILLSGLVLCGCLALAQTPAVRQGYVQASGSANLSVKPDQALLQLAVVTTAATANDASTQNASQVTAVLAALTGVLGASANIQTLSYTLQPNYNYPPNGQQMLTGYTATNTVQATILDLSVIGKVIDAGIAAGANRVQGLLFGLQNDQPQRTQALKMAAVQAKANADAMASGLGLTTGAVILVSQGATSTPSPLVLTGVVSGAQAPTPIENGVVNVQATVTIQVAIQ